MKRHALFLVCIGGVMSNRFNASSQTNFFNMVRFADQENGFIADAWQAKLFRTSDGGWSWSAQPFYSQCADLLFISKDNGFATVSSGGNSSSGVLLNTTDGGVHWTGQWGLSYGRMQFVNGGIGYVLAEYWTNYQQELNRQFIFKTTDSGRNWIEIFRVSPDSFGWFEDLSFISADTGFILSQNKELLQSVDGGASWNVAATFFSEEGNSHVHFKDSRTGWVAFSHAVYRTTDGFKSYERMGFSEEISGMKKLNGSGQFLLCKRGVLYRSLNGGADWTRIETGCDRILLDAAFLNPREGFIVGVDAVLYTDDAGDHWKQAEILEDSLHVHKSNCTAVEINPAMRAYPNPFKKSITLESNEFNAGESLCIFDALGNRIRAIEIEKDRTAVWDGRDLEGKPVAEGVYLIDHISRNGKSSIVKTLKIHP